MKAKLCFQLLGPSGVTEPPLSDFPANASAVRLHVRLRSTAVPLWRADFMLAKSNPVVFGAGGAQPAPNAWCPGACSHRGTCVASRDRRRLCLCHKGFRGRACEQSDSSACMNYCSRRGDCVARFCLCQQGSFGVDCSLQVHAESARQRVPYVPMYVYTLPSELSTLHHLYQNDPTDRGVFYANRVFLSQLMSRKDAVVSDPRAAALFFVPLMLVQVRGNLWEPYTFLGRVVHHLQLAYPWWNRSNGADHVFFTTQDRGGCWVPDVLAQSIVVSYFGFTETEAFFGHERRLPSAREGRLKSAAARRRFNLSLPRCFVPHKDVVVPVDFVLSAGGVKHLAGGVHEATCGACRQTLLIVTGSINAVLAEYSQGVRQAFEREHRHTRGVQFREGHWVIGELRQADFCLAPSGWGYGWRTYLALVAGCIPVVTDHNSNFGPTGLCTSADPVFAPHAVTCQIVQPLIHQAFQDLLPYDEFSLRFLPEEIPQIPEFLRQLPRRRVCDMRRSGHVYSRAIMWQPPHGRAYDFLMGSLCRRALHLFTKRGEEHPPWADCASLNAKQLLQGPSGLAGWLREVDASASASASAALSARLASAAALAVRKIT